MKGKEKSSEECKFTFERDTRRMIKNWLSVKTFPRLVFFVNSNSRYNDCTNFTQLHTILIFFQRLLKLSPNHKDWNF